MEASQSLSSVNLLNNILSRRLLLKDLGAIVQREDGCWAGIPLYFAYISHFPVDA